MLTRRQFLKVGLASGAVLAGAGWLALREGGEPAPGFQWLDKRAAADRHGPGSRRPRGMRCPRTAPARTRGRDAKWSAAFDRAVSGLSPGGAGGNRASSSRCSAWPPGASSSPACARPGHEATPDEVHAFLRRWRTSRFGLLRAGYQALTQLIVAAWYGNPASWERIGYPGPPALDGRRA